MKSMDDYHAVLAEAENQAQDKGILFYRTEELERKTKMMRRCMDIVPQRNFHR